MKLLRAVALLNALTSLLALVAMSAMTVIPSSDAERRLMTAGIVLLGFLLAWLVFAAWLKRPGCESSRLARSPWLRRLCLALALLYLLGILLSVLG